MREGRGGRKGEGGRGEGRGEWRRGGRGKGRGEGRRGEGGEGRKGGEGEGGEVEGERSEEKGGRRVKGEEGRGANGTLSQPPHLCVHHCNTMKEETHLSVSAHTGEAAGQHHVSGPFEAVDDGLPAAVHVVELGLDHRVVDVDSWQGKLALLGQLVQPEGGAGQGWRRGGGDESGRGRE